MRHVSMVFLVVLAGVGAAVAQYPPYPCPANAPNCVQVTSYLPAPANTRPAGWIVGEIRTFAFGGESKKAIDELAGMGWVECRGQSAIRSQFPALWQIMGDEWGSADRTNVFYLPDLRGMFLRGWNHGKTAPPNHQVNPYQGDLDAGGRVTPRPEAGEASGSSGASADKVGSVQADAVGPHRHQLARKVQFNSGTAGMEFTVNPGFPCCYYTDPANDSLGKETHPSNVYVSYFIYVGLPANDLANQQRIEPKR